MADARGMPNHDLKPEKLPIALDAAELARWKAAAARDGADNLKQWIKVLIGARCNDHARCGKLEP